MLCWKLSCRFMQLPEVLSLRLCDKALMQAEEELFCFYFDTAKANVDEYWLDLFLQAKITSYHLEEVLHSFRDCVLSNTKSTFSYKTLSLYHGLNFVYYPTPETAKLCQTTCHKLGLLKSKPGMQLELQRVLNRYGRRKGDYFSCKNVLANKLDAYGTLCKSLQCAAKDIASSVQNIRQATRSAGMRVQWQDRCRRLKRSFAEMNRRVDGLRRADKEVHGCALNVDRKKKVASALNKKVKDVQSYIDWHRCLEHMFLDSINATT